MDMKLAMSFMESYFVQASCDATQDMKKHEISLYDARAAITRRYNECEFALHVMSAAHGPLDEIAEVRAKIQSLYFAYKDYLELEANV